MFNFFQYKVKLMVGKINPFKIKEEFRLLNATNSVTSAKFQKKNPLNQYYSLYRFALPDQAKCLGTHIGDSIQLEKTTQDQRTLRQTWYPVSRIDDCSVFDIIAKNESEILSTLTSEESVTVKKNTPVFQYRGFGNIDIYTPGSGDQNESNSSGTLTQHQFRYLSLIVQNESIAKFFQLIEGICTNGDHTHVSLVQESQSIERAILLEELLWFVEEKKLTYSVVLEEVPEGYMGLRGHIKKEYLQDSLPPPTEDSLTMVAGDKPFVDRQAKLLEEIGFSKDRILEFVGEQP